MEHRTLRFKDVYVYSACINIKIFKFGEIFEINKCWRFWKVIRKPVTEKGEKTEEDE